MNHYRIVSRNGGYVAQVARTVLLFWSVWEDMFCGAMSDLPDVFNTPEEAIDAVRDWDARVKALAPDNYVHTFYIAENGQVCPTRDYD